MIVACTLPRHSFNELRLASKTSCLKRLKSESGNWKVKVKHGSESKIKVQLFRFDTAMKISGKACNGK